MRQLLTERNAVIQMRISLTDLNAMVEAGDLRYSVIAGQIRFQPAGIAEAVRRLRVQTQTLPRRSEAECQF